MMLCPGKHRFCWPNRLLICHFGGYCLYKRDSYLLSQLWFFSIGESDDCIHVVNLIPICGCPGQFRFRLNTINELLINYPGLVLMPNSLKKRFRTRRYVNLNFQAHRNRMTSKDARYPGVYGISLALYAPTE